MALTMDEKRIIAWVECRLLWDRLSDKEIYTGRTYPSLKEDAVKYLYNQGLLHADHYSQECPFCEEFHCTDCLWPDPFQYCMDDTSPYKIWTLNPTPANAKKVCEMLDRIKF